MKRPRLLLLDANAVFAAFRHGAWEALRSSYELVVPSTVVRTEAMFYDSRETGRRIWLDLPALVETGEIVEYEATATEVAATLARFRPPFRQRIDPGEAEAITYLLAHGAPDLRFVTSDGSALEAVAMLGLAESAMCCAATSARFRTSTDPTSSESTSTWAGSASSRAKGWHRSTSSYSRPHAHPSHAPDLLRNHHHTLPRRVRAAAAGRARAARA